MIGAKRWFDNKKLIKTQQYIKEVTEDIHSYRIRKIKWAIEELYIREKNLTIYKVQLYAGFGGNNKEMKKLIEKIMCTEDEG
jgi:hypothetical protein